MKYGLVTYKDTENIGDDIQSYVAIRFLPQIDYYIEREELDLFVPDKKEQVVTIMNGWFLHSKINFPISPYIYPIYVSTHLSSYNSGGIKTEYINEYTKKSLMKYGPIGCRDSSTVNLLTENNIDNYFSGCLTLTIQKDKKLKAVAFDLLCYAGASLVDDKYIHRIEVLNKLLAEAHNPYVYCTEIFYEDFAMHASCVIANGGEGLVIQRRDNPYLPGTRTAWKTLKLKQRMPDMELPVVDTVAPTKDYKGDFLENWSYFIDGQPVTKAYYYGWKNGIVVKYKDALVSVASGLTDEDKAWLATDEAAKAIQEGKLYAVIGAMSENDLGSLRHPYVLRLRTDVL